MKSRIVPVASGLLLYGVSLIAAAQPQALTALQMDSVAAGALPSLSSLGALAGSPSAQPVLSAFGLGDAPANLAARVTAARNAAAGIQTALRNGATQATNTAASLPTLTQARTNLTGILDTASFSSGTTAIAGIPAVNSVNGLTNASNVAGLEAGLAAVRAAAVTAASQSLPASLPASLNTAAGSILPALSNLTLPTTGSSNTNGLRSAAGGTQQVTRSPSSMSSATSTLPR